MFIELCGGEELCDRGAGGEATGELAAAVLDAAMDCAPRFLSVPASVCGEFTGMRFLPPPDAPELARDRISSPCAVNWSFNGGWRKVVSEKLPAGDAGGPPP